MKGDFSRDAFAAANHYSAVLLEQGGLITDADWKEQVDLTRYRVERETADVIGHCGGPVGAAAFSLTAGVRPRAIDADTVSPSNAWIAAEDGYVLHSSDGAASWDVIDTGTTAHLNAVRFAGAQGWVAGERGTVLRSADFGASWTQMEAGVRGTLRGVAAFGSQHVWAVGDSGVVVFSATDGTTWTSRKPTSAQLNAVAFANATQGIVVGSGGEILTTADGGQTWQRRTSNTTSDLFAVAFIDTTNAWAAGAQGTILRTTDSGATWTQQSSGSSSRLHAIAFSSSTSGAAAGDDGTLLRTTDGGTSWSPVATGTSEALRGLALQGNDAWLVTDSAVLRVVPLGGGAPTQSPLPAASLSIGAGRYYVQGTMCEVDEPVSYYNQPDRAAPSRLAPGHHLVYVHVWQRHLSALEAPSIREVALGDADPSSRARTVWQVKTLPLAAASPSAWHCLSSVPEWDALAWPPGARLSVRAEPQEQPTNLCDIGATAGYRRIENQLYRVEVQQGGTTPRVKMSRENGSVAFAIESIGTPSLGSPAETVVRLRSRGRDQNLDLTAGDWVEIVNDDLALEQRAGQLFRFLRDGDDPMEIVLEGAVPADLALDPSRHPLLRRWDHRTVQESIDVVEGTWIELEDGVQIRFEPGGTYRPGDYWLIPARTATGDVVWPRDASGAPRALPPAGIEDRYCRLGLVEVAADGTITVQSDCRNLFPPLTALDQLLYVSGDGQDGLPGQVLPQPLIVRVARGRHPIAGVAVRFEVESGNGQIVGSPAAQSLDVTTDVDGFAECRWLLDADIAASARHQTLSARLLDAAGNPLPGSAVIFAATGTVLLVHAGGDGQEGRASTALEQPLQVRVSNGQQPFAGAQVRFDVVAGGGQITGANPATTSPQGIASATWRLGGQGAQRVEARLLDSGGNVVQHVAFNAQIRPTTGPGREEGCAITIGPGAREPVLNTEVLKRLLEEHEGRVCLCFMAGVHEIDDLEVGGPDNARLSIHGCGQASMLILRGRSVLASFESIDISNLTLAMRPDAGLRFLRSSDVSLSGLSVAGEDATEIPFFEFETVRQIRVSGCQIRRKLPGVSIMFGDAESSIRISESDVEGLISFNGPPEFPVEEPEQLIERLREQMQNLNVQFEPRGGRITLEANRFEALALGRELMQQVRTVALGQSEIITGVFADAILDGNSFSTVFSWFLAKRLVVGSCAFMGERDRGSLATFIASSAAVTGNVAEQWAPNDDFIRWIDVITSPGFVAHAGNALNVRVV